MKHVCVRLSVCLSHFVALSKRLLGGTPVLRRRLIEIVSPSSTKFWHKTKIFVAAHNEDFVIPACNVLIGLQDVTDDRSTDVSTIVNTHLA